jgi:hypothetical protein
MMAPVCCLCQLMRVVTLVYLCLIVVATFPSVTQQPASIIVFGSADMVGAGVLHARVVGVVLIGAPSCLQAYTLLYLVIGFVLRRRVQKVLDDDDDTNRSVLMKVPSPDSAMKMFQGITQKT